MRKTIFGCLGVAAVAFALHFTQAYVVAGLFSTCRPCDEVAPCDDVACSTPCDAVCGTKAGKWFLHGHLEAGFFANGHGKTNNYLGTPIVPGNSALLQNTKLTSGQINQTYVSVGKSVDGKRGLDIGGTVDFIWGTDAFAAQTAGLEYNTGHGGRWDSGDYASAFAQAYAEIAYKRWNVKAGKFYAPFTSSSFKSTDNFFYSWASTRAIAPIVVGGAYATYAVNDKLTVLGGWVTPGEIGETSEHNDVLGGFIWTPGKRLTVQYAFAAGKNKNDALAPATPYDEFVQSLIMTTKIGTKLTYVFDWTLLNVNTDTPFHAAAYGLNNEIIYQHNKKWAFGTRFGMLNANNDLITANGYLPATSQFTVVNGDWYTVGLGANWTPNKWLTVKPEVRYDWSEDGTPFNGSSYQTSGGLSAVVKF